MDLEVEIKTEPVWHEGTDAYQSNAVDSGSNVKVESQSSVIPKVENGALNPKTEDIMMVENFDFVSGMIPLKEESKSELPEPEPTQENAFEASADVKDEIFIEEDRVDHLVPCFKEENNPENVVELTGVQVHSCHLCCKSFSGTSDLRRHLLNHSAEGLYSCAICNCIFANKSTLKTHLDIHSEERSHSERPFCCSVCNSTFTRQYNMRRHLLCHSGERPFRCKICNRTFALKDTLTKHLLTHYGDRPYHCTICNRSFAQKSNLKSHLLTHSQIRRYRCSECNNSFSRKGILKSHMASHLMLK